MKNLNLILVFISSIISFALFAQSPAIDWENTLWSNQSDFMYALTATPDGACITGGYSNNSAAPNGDKSETGNGSSDYWVIKLDASGAVEWNNVIGGSGADYLSVILNTTDGGYLLAGSSMSPVSGDKTLAKKGLWDYWVLKTDALGNILWQGCYGGSGTDILTAAANCADGGFVLGGNSNSNISGNKTENAIGDNDCWVIRIDNVGNIIWQNTIGGNDTEEFSAIQETTDGGFIAISSSESGISGDKTEPTALHDAWVFKLNSSGSIVWQNTIGGSSEDYGRDIQELADGNFIMGCESTSGISGDKTEPVIGEGDLWVLKLNSTGNIIWQHTIGGLSDEDLINILPADGEYFIAAISNSGIGADKTEFNLGGYDYWVIKMNESGSILWQNTLGGSGNDFMQESIITADGGYAMGGYSYSPVSGDKSEAYHLQDYWVIKLFTDACVAPEELYADNIFPNKATLHWDAIPGITNYQIWYRETGAGAWIKKSSEENFKTIKTLLPETEYEYKIRAKCFDGSFSDFSITSTFVTLPFKEGELKNNSGLEIYPNPANNFIKIELTGIDDVSSIEIFNISGDIIFSEIACRQEMEVDISGFPKGIYTVRISNNYESHATQFIKQ